MLMRLFTNKNGVNMSQEKDRESPPAIAVFALKSGDFPKHSKDEETLRELLFAEHSCDGKYGDDGERQCGSCMIDFRRDSVEEIKEKISYRNLKRWKKWSEEHDNLPTLSIEDSPLPKLSPEETNLPTLQPGDL